MKMKEIAPNIDFSDASYKSCEMHDGNLTITIDSWDGKTITIFFSKVVGFIYKTGSIISGAYENENQSLFLKETLFLYYETQQNENEFKSFCIQDIEDFIFIEIIAKSALATKK